MASVDSRDYVLSGIYYSVLDPTPMCETQCGLSTLPPNMTFTQCCSNAGPLSATLAQHQTSTGSTPVFAGLRSIARWSGSDYCWPSPTQCMLNVGPASPVLASIH